VSAIAELAADRVVEGVYAVSRKRRLRTRGGASYLALELVDPSGRIEARVWSDVDLLDARFAEGDAVHVLGRVEKFRDRLQLEIRSLEAAPGEDAAALAPTMRRDADELDGFLEFLAAEISHPGLRATVDRRAGDHGPMASRAGVVAVALVLVLAACGSGAGRQAATTTTTRPVRLATGITLSSTDEIEPGYAQGIAFLWSQEGVLLGTASQTVSAKRWGD